MGNITGGKSTPPDLEKRYDLRHIIDRGRIAVIKAGLRRADKSEIAVRIIKKGVTGHAELKIATREIQILLKLQHSNVLRVHEIFDTNRKIYVVMEMLNGGDLFDRIVAKNRLSEREASAITLKLCEALQYIHSKGVIHRDVKPENILFAKVDDITTPKLCNFSLAIDKVMKTNENESKSRLSRTSMLTPCGTPTYLAPEIIEQKGYNEAVDVWSLGVTTYSMLCGYPPFYHEKLTGLYGLIRKGDYAFHEPHWSTISDDAKDLVQKMLQIDAANRISTDAILKHPWIRKMKATKAPKS